MEDGDTARQTEATSFNTRLFEQMRDMHRTWLERLQGIRHLESDFGTRLMTAKSRPEAAIVCGEWIAKHVETIADEQKTFAKAWLRLIVDMLGSASAVSAKTSEHDHKSAE
jgi:hypothetical protein